MNSESRAAVSLLIYGAVLSVAIVLAVAHAPTSYLQGVLAFGALLLLVWSIGPIVAKVVRERRH